MFFSMNFAISFLTPSFCLIPFFTAIKYLTVMMFLFKGKRLIGVWFMRLIILAAEIVNPTPLMAKLVAVRILLVSNTIFGLT
jgi:hypothetical protein